MNVLCELVYCTYYGNVCMYIMYWLRREWSRSRGGDTEDSDSVTHQRTGAADRRGGALANGVLYVCVCIYEWMPMYVCTLFAYRDV